MLYSIIMPQIYNFSRFVAHFYVFIETTRKQRLLMQSKSACQKKTVKIEKTNRAKVKRARTAADLSDKFKIGDSVVVYPDKKIGQSGRYQWGADEA